MLAVDDRPELSGSTKYVLKRGLEANASIAVCFRRHLMLTECTNMQQDLIEVLIQQSELLADQIAFTFLSDSNNFQESISFAQLHQDACNIAVALQAISER